MNIEQELKEARVTLEKDCSSTIAPSPCLETNKKTKDRTTNAIIIKIKL